MTLLRKNFLKPEKDSLRAQKALLLGMLMISFLQTGCGSYKEDFDCPVGKGLKCASLSEVHRNIDEGLLGEEASTLSLPSSCDGDTCCPSPLVSRSGFVPFYYPKKVLPSGEVIPARVVYVRPGS
tara:strand:+ start:1881 stop:2255 length:375 start_codon:yes stop_codon:yes gene_type:complete